MWDPYAEFESATLPNGLTIHASHWPDRPWQAMGFLVHSGAEQDPVGREGLAHFVEHLVSHSTQFSKRDLRSFFGDFGGSINLGMTNYLETEYAFFLPADGAILSKALSLFGNMLLHARLDKQIEHERKVIIGEFHQHYHLNYLFNLLMRERQAVYSGYWLERSTRPLGNLTSIQRISEIDLRSYYAQYYTPANISIVSLGGMTLSEIVELLVESSFSSKKPGNRVGIPTRLATVSGPLETRNVLLASRYISAPMRTFSYRSVTKIPGIVHSQTLYIFSEMLRQILNDEIRERRAWTYSIGTSFENFRHFHQFSIDSDGLDLSAIDEIEQVIDACILTLNNHKNLFEQVKKRVVNSSQMLDWTGRSICSNVMRSLTIHGRIITLTESIKRFEEVTFEDIGRLVEYLQPERRWTSIVKP